MSAKFLATVYNFFLHLVSRPSLQQNERERWKQGLYKGKWLGIHYGIEQGIRFIITSHYDARYTEGNDNYSCVPLNGRIKGVSLNLFSFFKFSLIKTTRRIIVSLLRLPLTNGKGSLQGFNEMRLTGCQKCLLVLACFK